MCIEREKVDFKSREVNCLKECALALTYVSLLHLKPVHAVFKFYAGITIIGITESRINIIRVLI